MIFYGWRYYNKKNSRYFRERCPDCGYTGYLHSYDSTKYFHLYWIPVIPIGGHHVISDCPNCNAVRGVPLGKWKKMKLEVMEPALQQFRMNPKDREAAHQAIGLVLQFQNRNAFQQIERPFASLAEGDKEFMSILAGTYSFFGMDQQAERTYLKALELNDEAAFTQEAQNFLELQKDRMPAPPVEIFQRLPTLIVPILIIFTLFSLYFAGESSQPEHVYAVNGLDVPYSIVVNGQKVAIPVRAHVKLDVPYGEVSWQPAPDCSIALEEGSLTIDASFSQKMSGGPFIIINPDKQALIDRSRTVYTTDESYDGEDEHEVFVNQAFYEFRKIDYYFQEFPEEIMSQSSGNVKIYKTRLYEIEDYPLFDKYAIISNYRSDAALVDYLRTHLHYYPEDALSLYYFSSLVTPEEAVEFLRPKLSQRPVRVEWHRSYQSLIENSFPDYDLIQEYTEMLANEPDNGALLYLLGRIHNDSTYSMKLYKKAMELPDPFAYAFYASGYLNMQKGLFKQALPLYEKALELNPEGLRFESMVRIMRLATGKYAELLAECSNSYLQNPEDMDALQMCLYLHAKLGQTNELDELTAELMTKVKSDNALASVEEQERVLQEYRAWVGMTCATAVDDLDQYLSFAALSQNADTYFYYLAGSMKLEEANQVLDEYEISGQKALHLLLLYALAVKKKDEAEARVFLISAISELEYGDKSAKIAAEWFKGEHAPRIEELLGTSWMPEDLRIILVALAARYPDNAERYYKLARRHNYDPEFPKTVLKKLL